MELTNCEICRRVGCLHVVLTLRGGGRGGVHTCSSYLKEGGGVHTCSSYLKRRGGMACIHLRRGGG